MLNDVPAESELGTGATVLGAKVLFLTSVAFRPLQGPRSDHLGHVDKSGVQRSKLESPRTWPWLASLCGDHSEQISEVAPVRTR